MRLLAAVVVAVVSLPSVLPSQVYDTLTVGDRVRVRVGEARGYTNVFIGRIGALSRDTLTLDIPHDKGTMVFPRSAISEIAVPNGRESRWAHVGAFAPMLALPVVLATTTVTAGPHANAMRNRQLVLAAGLLAIPVVHILNRQPAERWEAVYRWLDAK